MAFLHRMLTVGAPGKGREQFRLSFIEPLVQCLYRAAADHKRGIPEVAGCRKQVGKPDVHTEDPFRVLWDRCFLLMVVKGHQDTEVSVERLHFGLYISGSFKKGSISKAKWLFHIYKTQVCLPIPEKEFRCLVGPPGRGSHCPNIPRDTWLRLVLFRMCRIVTDGLKIRLPCLDGLTDGVLVHLAVHPAVDRMFCCFKDCIQYFIGKEPVRACRIGKLFQFQT